MDTLEAENDETLAYRILMDVGDPALLARVRTTCEPRCMKLADFLAQALERGSGATRGASWRNVADILQKTGAPGLAALSYMLEIALDRESRAAS